MNHHDNITRIKAVHNNLEDLKDKVVYVGGATISFYTDRQTPEVRPTDDIDVIIEILNYSERSKIEEKLRALGFQHDMESKIVCRYIIGGISIDIMPTDDDSIGFKNYWYPEGYKNSVEYKIDESHTVKILSPPYFIATKLEAHKGRGKGDGRTSHDFEDIIYVLENRSTIWDELNNTTTEMKMYLVNEFRTLLENPGYFEWIDCHVERGSPPATYFIIDQLRKFVESNH